MNDEVRAGVPDLFEAVHGGDEDAVVRLLRAGTPGDVCGADGESALYVAAVGGEPGIVRLLLAAGAAPDRLSSGTDLPLCGAACGGHADVVRALLAAGAGVDAVEEFGFRALTWAVQLGREAVVRALLDGGADPRLPGPQGALPLVAAVRRGSTGCVRALLERGAPGREAALAEAVALIGVDVAERLRAGLVESAVGGADRETVTQRFAEGGGVTVVVQLLDEAGRPASGNEQQTGHAAIATLLEASLGIVTAPGELADRAVRCTDPDNDDWAEAMEVLRRRGDDATFRAAAAWCVDRDPLRRAFAADVLGQLGPPGPDGVRPYARRSLPVLRRLARALARQQLPAEETEGGANLPDTTATERQRQRPRQSTEHDPGPRPPHAVEAELRSLIDALGHHHDPVALPEVIAFAAHPSPGVRRAVALALRTLASSASPDDEVLATLIALTRDTSPEVRTWAAVALAGTDADTPPVRAALTALLGDAHDDVAAEAARGLAARQDLRAVDTLVRLLAQSPPTCHAHDVARDAARAFTDVRVRNLLERTWPRGA